MFLTPPPWWLGAMYTLCVFDPPWWLGAMYTVHLTLIGKRIVDFLFVLIELFSLGVTAEAL